MLTRRRRSGSRPPSARAASAINVGSRQSADIAGARSRAAIPNSIATQRLDQTRLGGWQQFREHGQVIAAGGAELERSVHIDADHVAARREAQLALAGEQHDPGLMLLKADQGVLAVGAELPVGSGLASGAGQSGVAAGSAILGPSAWLEVPAAEGPDNDMDASR
jgi:hypothetical protein